MMVCIEEAQQNNWDKKKRKEMVKRIVNYNK
jgi:hypothetical protein